MTVASAWSRLQAEEAAAEKAADRAAKPKRKPAAKAATQLLTITDLAHRLNVSRSSIYRLMDGGLPHLRVGYTVRFDLPVVMQWFADYTAAGRKAHWSDQKPELQQQGGPTVDLPPSHQRTPTADLPPGRRGAAVTRRPHPRSRRINPDRTGGSNGED